MTDTQMEAAHRYEELAGFGSAGFACYGG